MVEENGKKEIIKREAPQLVAVLKEMTDGLDNVRTKVDALTDRVKAGLFPRKEGISYLEAKHLLLLNYCQSLVYYLLRKAKGLSIEGHPVVKSLVEIRLFLEKIRPIDKKLEYQIKKLTGVSVTRNLVENPDSVEKESDTKNKDLLKYRPNPELLIGKTDVPHEGAVGAYRPPKFAPASMGEDKISRRERNAKRMEEKNIRQSRESDYIRELIDDIEGKPEEVREVIGGESREHRRFVARLEKRAREEEEVFTRAPLTKAEKKQLTQLKKSRNGLLDLTESFYDEIRSLPTEAGPSEVSTSIGSGSSKGKKFKRHRRNH